MKKIVGLQFLIFVLFACNQFDDSYILDKLADHEERIEKLELNCRQLNNNIVSIQTILESLQNNDYVTSVLPLVEDGDIIGYTMTFSKSGNVVIYHGKDASIPQIAVKQDVDDFWYWTIDGEWVLDDRGNKIKAVGSEGKDGVTPMFKIEEGYWCVSYDNGSTWIMMDQAMGEDGDSFFQSVSYDEYHVYLTLSDGLEIVLPTKALVESIQIVTSEVRLAKRYDLVVGDTFQLFYTGVVKAFNVQNEGIRVVCEVGKQFGRYFEYTPTEIDAGRSYKLSITTRRFDGSIISCAETVLVIHDKLSNATTPSNLDLLIFGDSLTASGIWAGEGLRRIYGSDNSIVPQSNGVTNMCTTYGTKHSVVNGYSVYHEGYGGWTWASFLMHSLDNPFYNSDNDIISFKYHAEKYDNNGADLVAVLLTWNGAGISGDFNYSTSISKHMVNAATLLRNIHNDFPLAKIICLGIQISSLNGGTGESYGATGAYSDPYATAFYAFDYNLALEELLSNEEFSSYCYYVDTKGQFDTEYNMPSKDIPVNNRNDSTTEVVGTNGVHPSIQGYCQIGDAFYRALHRVLPILVGKELELNEQR